jgi:hypothetical protein
MAEIEGRELMAGISIQAEADFYGQVDYLESAVGLWPLRPSYSGDPEAPIMCASRALSWRYILMPCRM